MILGGGDTVIEVLFEPPLVEVAEIVQGPRGAQGPAGDNPGDEPPVDLTVLFDNALV